MERETKKLTLPISKKEVEIKTYITGRESREIRDVFLKEMKVSGVGGEVKEVNASLQSEAENKAIKIIIVSINGDKNDILDKILDLPLRDYNFVMKEINEVESGLSAEKKTK